MRPFMIIIVLFSLIIVSIPMLQKAIGKKDYRTKTETTLSSEVKSSDNRVWQAEVDAMRAEEVEKEFRQGMLEKLRQAQAEVEVIKAKLVDAKMHNDRVKSDAHEFLKEFSQPPRRL